MDKSACTAFVCFTLNLAQHSEASWALPHFSNAHSHSSWGLQVEPEMSKPQQKTHRLVHRLYGVFAQQFNTQQHRQVVGSPLKQIQSGRLLA